MYSDIDKTTFTPARSTPPSRSRIHHGPSFQTPDFWLQVTIDGPLNMETGITLDGGVGGVIGFYCSV